MSSRNAAPPGVAAWIGEGMVAHRLVLRSRDIVFFKGVIEASDGLAAVFAERGSDVWVAAPADRSLELESVLAALCAELGALRVDP